MRKNESFGMLLQHIRETIYIKKIDADPSKGRIDFVSDNVAKLLGYKAKDFYENQGLWSSIIHPDDVKGIEKKVKNIFKSKKPLRLTYRIRHKKTKMYRWVEDIVTPQFDEHKRGIGFAGSLIDITEQKELEESPAQRESHFKGMFEKATVGIYHTSPDGQILYTNRALVKMLGFKSLKEMQERNLNESGYEPRYSRKDFMRRIDDEGVITGLESAWKKKDGKSLHVRESAHVVRDKDGNVLYYEGTVEDLTEIKLAQERIVRLNQILRTLSNINQLIVRNATPEILFHEACSILIKDGKYRMAWIGILDESHRVVHPIAWNGVEDGYLKEIIVIGGNKLEKRSLIREAIRTGLASVCNDIENDPAYTPWRREARRKGYRSTGTFPIRISGKVVGVINLFADSVNSFTPEEIHLLSELADDIGFALWTIEVRARERASNDTIKDREFWLTESQRVARVGSYIFDINSKTITSSPMLDEICGMDSGSMNDTDSFLSIIHPQETERLRKYFRKIIVEKSPCDIEFRIEKPSDKEERWIWCKGELMLDSSGKPVSMFGTIQDITDRKRAEEALSNERILLRTLIDNLPHSVYVKDRDYRKIIANPANLRHIGLNSESEVLGKTDFDVFPSELAEKFYIDDQRVIRDGKPVVNREEYVFDSEGNKRWLLTTKVPLRDENGVTKGLVGVGMDITDRKLAEETMERERILLRTLIDNLPSAIFVKDREYRKTVVNTQHVKSVAAQLGSLGLNSEADILGKTDFDIYPKEIAESYLADDEKVVRDGKSILNKVETGINPQGRQSWLLVSKIPLRDKDGGIIGMVGITTEITAQKEAEEAQKREGILLRTLIDNLPNSVYVKDREYRARVVNLAAIRTTTAKSEAEIIGKTDFDFWPKEVAENFFADDQKVIMEGHPVIDKEECFTAPDGEKHWQITTKLPLRDEKGSIVGLVGVGTDITDRKKIEVLLRESEERFHAIFEDASVGIYRTTPDGRVLLANPAMQRILGISSSDKLSDYDLEREGHFSTDFPRLKFRELIDAQGSVTGLESKKLRKDGGIFWIRENSRVVYHKDGEIAYYEGTVEDISERKRVEQALEHERFLLRTLIDNLPASIFIKDKEYRKTVINGLHLRNIAKQLNIPELGSESAILGKTDFDIYPRDLAEEYFVDDQRVIRDGETILNREELRISPEGKREWVSISKIPLRDKTDEIVGLLGMVSDITDRKLAEDQRERERILLRTLIDHLPNAVFVKDKKYRKILVNRAHALAVENYHRLMGLTPNREILGLTDFEVYPKEVAEKYFMEDRKVIEEGNPVLDREELEVDRNGVRNWTLISKIPLRDEKGEVTGLVGITTDITTQKIAEEALRESENTLKQITNSIEDIIYSVDGQTGEFTYFSPVFERKLGYSLSDVVEMGGRWAFMKKVIQSDSTPADDPIIGELHGQVVSQIPVWENWWRCKDGTLLYFEDESTPTYIGNKLVRVDGVLRDITEWKRSEDSKQRERILLRTLIDNIPYPIYVKDKEYRKVVSNPADVRNIGCNSEAEVLGKTDFELFAKEFAEKFFVDDQTVIRDGKAVLNREEYFFDRDGNKRWFLTSKIPLLDERGSIIGLVGIGADVTEQKAINEALRRSEMELLTLFESMKDVILVLDKDGRFLRVSPTDDSILYRPGSEIIGKMQSEIFPKDQADYFLSVIRKTLDSGQTQNVEYGIDIRREAKWRSATVSPLTKESVLWVARDITERKSMEKEITESEKKYRELVENALVGVYRMTLSGRIIYANKAMADMLEYDSPQEMESVKAFDLYKNETERENFSRELRSHGKTGKSNEVELVTKTGKVKNVLLSASLDGEIISGMAKDITEIRTLERQFLQTQKLEGLGNIAAGIAHDFNNILGVILGYADLLRQSAFEPKKFERGTQAIMKSAERGKSLVKQLLTFARKTETTFGSVLVNEIVSEIEKLMEETFPKTIVITTKLRDDLPVISGDSSQIHQVLLNICVNARDALPKGGKLTISTDVVAHETLVPKFPEAVAEKYVAIRLEDNGMGMDEETRRRIFEPFFTTKEVGKGTGLGLSVVYGIMQSHRGFVDVISDLDEGTTFTIYFPVFEGILEETTQLEQSNEEISGGTDLVLIIEDEEMLRDLLRSMLESKGYGVLMARDGEEGVQTFQKNKDQIAVVLSDLGLPKLSGEEVVGFIRQIKPEVKVMIASGFIDHDVRSRLEEAGVKAFIQKPYKANEVLKGVRDAIKKGDA